MYCIKRTLCVTKFDCCKIPTAIEVIMQLKPVSYTHLFRIEHNNDLSTSVFQTTALPTITVLTALLAAASDKAHDERKMAKPKVNRKRF